MHLTALRIAHNCISYCAYMHIHDQLSSVELQVHIYKNITFLVVVVIVVLSQERIHTVLSSSFSSLLLLFFFSSSSIFVVVVMAAIIEILSLAV